MIKQTIITRTSITYDNGTMGFTDYETRFEKFDEFINRVTNFLNDTKGEIISVSYPDSNTSVITYKES